MSVSTTRAGTLLRRVPPSLFSLIVGLAALVVALQQAEALWHLPVLYSPYLLTATSLTGAALCGLYAIRMVRHPGAARADMTDATQLSYLCGIPIGLMLIAIAFDDRAVAVAASLSYAAMAILVMLIPAVIFAGFRAARGDKRAARPVWLLPAIASLLVPIAGVRYFPASVLWFFFALGLASWLGLLALMVRRIAVHGALADYPAPTLSLPIAAPAAAFIAYVQLSANVDVYAQLLYFVALLFTVAFLSQSRRLAATHFALVWWTCVLPVALLTAASMLMYTFTLIEFYKSLALLLLFLSAAIVVSLLLATARATLIGRLVADP